MKIVGVNFFCLTALACLKMLRTEAIVSTKAEEKKDERKGDSQVSQTTNREYGKSISIIQLRHAIVTLSCH